MRKFSLIGGNGVTFLVPHLKAFCSIFALIYQPRLLINQIIINKAVIYKQWKTMFAKPTTHDSARSLKEN